jgi:hypothetical protein
MKNDPKDDGNEPVRVELKYCEHCGGLWLRETGAGVVYCDNCRPKIADLPPARKKPRGPMLPVRPHTAVEDYEPDLDLDLRDEDDDDDEFSDFQAAGGAA